MQLHPPCHICTIHALQLIEGILSNMDDSKTEPTLEDRFAVKKLNIDGLCAAVYTPFNILKQVNPFIIERQAAYLNKSRVKSVLVSGTSGECASLTISEKKQVLKEWMNVAPKYRLNVIFAVGPHCLNDSCGLAIYAESIGVDAIAVMPPSYVKPSCIESLLFSIKKVADCVPLLPVYYYHNPCVTGVHLSMYDFLFSADKVIPNLVGLMDIGLYEEMSFPMLQKILNYKNGERYEVIVGKEEMMLQCLVSGAVGFVGSQYNFAGDLYNKIIQNFEKGNITKAQQLSLNAISLMDVQKNDTGSNKEIGKYVMKLVGVDVGPARLPFLPLNETEKRTVHVALQEWCQGTSD
eukprot:1125287_1